MRRPEPESTPRRSGPGLRYRRVFLVLAAAAPLPWCVPAAQAQSGSEAAEESPAAPAGMGVPAFGGGVVPGGIASFPGEAPVRLGGFFGFPYGGEDPVPLGGTAPARSWTVVPSLGVQVMATDNVFPGSRSKQSDVVTSLMPQLVLQADTARVQGRLSYAPTLRYYLSHSGEERIDHTFNGSALTTIVPGSVFLDLRGSAAVLPVSGGFADEDGSSLSRGNRSQTASFQATPYYIQRFGGLATSLVGYTYQYGTQSGRSASLTPGGQPFFTPQDFSSHTGFAAVRTGEDFGRLALEARVNGTTYDGSGVLDGAYRTRGVLETRYAFDRIITGILEGGYEDQKYGGVPPVRISGPVWAIGVQLTPGPDTLVTVRYRRQDGFDSPSVEARVALGARTVLFGGYSDRLSTTLQNNADLLSTTSVDALGNPIDTRTGAPTRDFANSTLMTAQSGLFRIKRGFAAVSQSWERDTLSLNLTREERVPVAVAVNTVAFQQETDSVGVSWARSLTPFTTFAASAQYGWIKSSTSGTLGETEGNTYTVRASLAHSFNPTLVGSLQYLLTNRSTEFTSTGAGFGNDSVRNAVTATLRKTF